MTTNAVPRAIALIAHLASISEVLSHLGQLGIHVHSVDIGCHSLPTITVSHCAECEALKLSPDGATQTYDHHNGIVIVRVVISGVLVLWWERLTKPNLVTFH